MPIENPRAMRNQIVLKIAVLLFFVFNQFAPDLCALERTNTANPLYTNGLSQNDLPRDVFSIPSELGVVQKSWGMDAKTRPWVIHIQDLHVDYEAQKHMSQILEKVYAFLKNYASQELDKGLFIAMEGACGPVDPQFFSSFPEAQVREDTSDYFLRQAKFTGPEFFSIIHPDWRPEIFGIEDAQLYLQNKEVYRQCITSQKSQSAWLQSLRKAEKKLEKKLSKNGRFFLKKSRQYESGKLSLEKYFYFLKRAADFKNSKENYLHLQNFSHFLALGKKINPDLIERQRNLLTQSFVKRLPKEEWAGWIRKGLEYRLGKIRENQYFEYLESQAGKASFEEYPELAQYMRFVKMKSKIDFALVLREIKILESRYAETFFKSFEEKELWKFFKAIQLIKKLLALKLSCQELKEFISGKKNMLALLTRYDVSPSIDLTPFERFYELAQARDHVLLENTLKRMKETQRSVVILITGGFHTDAFTRSLEQSGISYTVVTPKTEGVSPWTEEIYRKRMLGEPDALGEFLKTQSNTLHQGSLLHALTGSPDAAKALEAALRAEFELTAGGAGMAGRISNMAQRLASRRDELKITFPDVADLEFFPQEIAVGESRFILARKGQAVFVLRFIPKKSKQLWKGEGVQILANGVIGSYHVEMMSAGDFSRTPSDVLSEDWRKNFGQEACLFLGLEAKAKSLEERIHWKGSISARDKALLLNSIREGYLERGLQAIHGSELGEGPIQIEARGSGHYKNAYKVDLPVKNGSSKSIILKVTKLEFEEEVMEKDPHCLFKIKEATDDIAQTGFCPRSGPVWAVKASEKGDRAWIFSADWVEGIDLKQVFEQIGERFEKGGVGGAKLDLRDQVLRIVLRTYLLMWKASGKKWFIKDPHPGNIILKTLDISTLSQGVLASRLEESLKQIPHSIQVVDFDLVQTQYPLAHVLFKIAAHSASPGRTIALMCEEVIAVFGPSGDAMLAQMLEEITSDPEEYRNYFCDAGNGTLFSIYPSVKNELTRFTRAREAMRSLAASGKGLALSGVQSNVSAQSADASKRPAGVNVQAGVPAGLSDDGKGQKALFPWAKDLPGYSKWGPIFENLWTITLSFPVLFVIGKAMSADILNDAHPLARLVSALALPTVFALFHLPKSQKKGEVFLKQWMAGLLIFFPFFPSIFVMGLPSLMMSPMILGGVLIISFIFHFMRNGQDTVFSIFDFFVGEEEDEEENEEGPVDVRFSPQQRDVIEIVEGFHQKERRIELKRAFYALLQILKDTNKNSFHEFKAGSIYDDLPVALKGDKVSIGCEAFLRWSYENPLFLEMECIRCGMLLGQQRRRDEFKRECQLLPPFPSLDHALRGIQGDSDLKEKYIRIAQVYMGMEWEIKEAQFQCFLDHGGSLHGLTPLSWRNDLRMLSLVRGSQGVLNSASFRLLMLDQALHDSLVRGIFRALFELEIKEGRFQPERFKRLQKDIQRGRSISLVENLEDDDLKVLMQSAFMPYLLGGARPTVSKSPVPALFSWARDLPYYKIWGPIFENLWTLGSYLLILGGVAAVAGVSIAALPVWFQGVLALGLPLAFALFHIPKSQGAWADVFRIQFKVGLVFFLPLILPAAVLGVGGLLAQSWLLILGVAAGIVLHYWHNRETFFFEDFYGNQDFRSFLEGQSSNRAVLAKLLRKRYGQMSHSAKGKDDFEKFLQALDGDDYEVQIINTASEPSGEMRDIPIEVIGNTIHINDERVIRYLSEKPVSLDMFCIRAGVAIRQKEQRKSFEKKAEEIFPENADWNAVYERLKTEDIFRMQYRNLALDYLNMELEAMKAELAYLGEKAHFDIPLNQYHQKMRDFVLDGDGNVRTDRLRLFVLHHALRYSPYSRVFQLLIRLEIEQKNFSPENVTPFRRIIEERSGSFSLIRHLTRGEVSSVLASDSRFLSEWFHPGRSQREKRESSAGAFKTPGDGRKAQLVDQKKTAAVQARLDSSVYQGLKIERLEKSKFPQEHADDFAYYAPGEKGQTAVIYVREDLYDRIFLLEKTDRARFEQVIEILRRHEYVENVLLPRLIEDDLRKPESERIFQESDRDRRHAITSALDASFNGVLHPLMELVIPLMSDEDLQYIERDHPNDPNKSFYLAVIQEQERRLKGKVLKLARRVLVPQGDREIMLYVNKELLRGEKEDKVLNVEEIKNEAVRHLILKIAACASTNVPRQENVRSVEIELGGRGERVPRFDFDDDPLRRVQMKGVVFDAEVPRVPYRNSSVEGVVFSPEGHMSMVPYSDAPYGGAWLKGVLAEFLNTSLLYQAAMGGQGVTPLYGVAQTKYPLVWGEFPSVASEGRSMGFIALGMNDETSGRRGFESTVSASFQNYGRLIRHLHDAGFIHLFPHSNNVSISDQHRPVLHDLDGVFKREGLSLFQDSGYLYYELRYILLQFYIMSADRADGFALDFLRGYFNDSSFTSSPKEIRGFLHIFDLIKMKGGIAGIQVKSSIFERLQKEVAGTFIRGHEEISHGALAKPSTLKIPAKVKGDGSWPPGKALQEKRGYLKDRVDILLRHLGEEAATEYTSIPVVPGEDLEFEAIRDRSKFRHEDDFSYYDFMRGEIRVHPRLWEKIKGDKEAKRILQRHEWVESKIIADSFFHQDQFPKEDQIFTEEDLRHAHALASGVDARLEGGPVHALMKHVIEAMSIEELKNVEPFHLNDPEGAFYAEVQKERQKRYSQPDLEADAAVMDAIKSKIKFHEEEKIGDRDKEAIARALGKMMIFDENREPVLLDAIESIYGFAISLESIDVIDIRILSDEGDRKRVYKIEVRGVFSATSKKVLPFVLKVFQGKAPISQTDSQRVRDAGVTLKTAGMHPSIGPHVHVTLGSGEEVTVYTEGLIQGQTLAKKIQDLKNQFDREEIEPSQYQEQLNQLYRAAIVGVLQMWKSLNGCVIKDPEPSNVMLQEDGRGGYQAVFPELENLSGNPLSMAEVLDMIHLIYGEKEGYGPRVLGDALMDCFDSDEARRFIRQVLTEEIPRLRRASGEKPVDSLTLLELALNAYLDEGISGYRRLQYPDRAHLHQTQQTGDKEEEIERTDLAYFRDLAQLLFEAYEKALRENAFSGKGRVLTEKDIRIKVRESEEERELSITEVEDLERERELGARKTNAVIGDAQPYRRRIKNVKGVKRSAARETYGELFKRVNETLGSRPGPVVVRIAGREGSGKTALARAIAKWGLNTIRSEEVSVLHADLFEGMTALTRAIEREKKKGKKLILVEGTYSLKGREGLFDPSAPALRADLTVFVEVDADTRMERLSAEEDRGQKWLDYFLRKARTPQAVKRLTEKFLSGEMAEQVLKTLEKSRQAGKYKNQRKYLKQARNALRKGLLQFKREEARAFKSFARVKNFVDRYTIDQERSTADIIMKNDFNPDLGRSENNFKMILSRILRDLKGRDDGDAIEQLMELFRDHASHLFVLRLEDLIQGENKVRFLDLEPSPLEALLHAFLESEKRSELESLLAEGIRLVQGRLGAVTKHAPGEERLSKLEEEGLAQVIHQRPYQVMGQEDFRTHGVTDVLNARAMPPYYKEEHDLIAGAILSGQSVKLLTSLQIGEESFQSARVEVCVVDRGEEKGFRLPGRSRSIYEWTEAVKEKGGAVLRIYVTKAFVEDSSRASSVFAQSLIHSLVERILGRSHMEAVQHESFYNQSPQDQSDVRSGEVRLSDLTGWILEEAAQEGDWNYLRRMTEVWSPDRVQNPIADTFIEERADDLSDRVTKRAWELFLKNTDLISSVLKELPDQKKLFVFLKEFWRRTSDDELKQRCLDALTLNPLFRPSWIKDLSKFPEFRNSQEMLKTFYAQILAGLQEKMMESLLGQGVRVSVPDRTLATHDYTGLLAALGKFQDWRKEMRISHGLARNATSASLFELALGLFGRLVSSGENRVRRSEGPIQILIEPSLPQGEIIVYQDEKIYISEAALDRGEEYFFVSLRNALCASILSSEAGLENPPAGRDEELETRLAAIHPVQDLSPIDASVLDILGGEDLLRPWFEKLGLKESFADFKGRLNQGGVHFVLNPGVMGRHISYRLWKNTVCMDGKALAKGTLLLDYGTFDALLTQASLSQNDQARHAYYLWTFTLLLQAVYDVPASHENRRSFEEHVFSGLGQAFSPEKILEDLNQLNWKPTYSMRWDLSLGELQVIDGTKVVQSYDLKKYLSDPDLYPALVRHWGLDGIRYIQWTGDVGRRWIAYDLNSLLLSSSAALPAPFQKMVFRNTAGQSREMFRIGRNTLILSLSPAAPAGTGIEVIRIDYGDSLREIRAFDSAA